ncbi:MAG: hypothetical protein IT198_12325 [Acidimicrobiia bacterium]|nr:hypothetical protein [Acidimicrobiia bacterium]
MSKFVIEGPEEVRDPAVPLRRDQVTTPEDLLEFLDIEGEPREVQRERIVAWVASERPDPEGLLMHLLEREGWLDSRQTRSA